FDRAVTLQAGGVVADKVKVIIERLPASGGGEIALDFTGAQLDDTAGLLVHAHAQLTIVECRAPDRRPGFECGCRPAFDERVTPAGERRQVAYEQGQLTAGKPLGGDRNALRVGD